MTVKQVLLICVFAFSTASAGIFNFANMLNDYNKMHKPSAILREQIATTVAPTAAPTTEKLMNDEIKQLAMTIKLAKYWLRQLKTTLRNENIEKAGTEKVIEHEMMPENFDLPQKWLSVGLGR
uniref:Uncharacterized protein n=1 Tax=Plectus sambesii TaxID=2011161 RepID=A0A914V6B9_9BILA